MTTAASAAVLAGVVVAVWACAGVGPAAAVGRPRTDGVPPAGSTVPDVGVVLPGPCHTTTAGPIGPTTAPTWARVETLRPAWVHGRGEGQTVAVIDTGVNPGPRLPDLRGIGDLVAGRQGLDDCDAHGTLVAGVVAAAPDPVSGTSGVAPGVHLLSLRQSSSVFRPVRPVDDGSAPTAGVGTLASLARAIRVAADAGATVITLSEVACVPAGTALADSALGAAIRYAATEKDVVVVTAAGNLGPDCGRQNPARPDALRPGRDPFDDVVTVSSPAWYDGLVLAVGAVDEHGSPASFSLHGPWIDVAAPGTGIVTVGADGAGVATRVVTPDGSSTPIEGTSFSAPFVAGVAALVRQAFPRLSAREVIARIESTTVPAPGGRDHVVGTGVVDPVAAVTRVHPGSGAGSGAVPLSTPVADPGRSASPGTVVAAVVLVGGVLALAGAGAVRALRRRDATGPR